MAFCLSPALGSTKLESATPPWQLCIVKLEVLEKNNVKTIAVTNHISRGYRLVTPPLSTPVHRHGAFKVLLCYIITSTSNSICCDFLRKLKESLVRIVHKNHLDYGSSPISGKNWQHKFCRDPKSRILRKYTYRLIVQTTS